VTVAIGTACVVLAVMLWRERRRRGVAEARVAWLQRIMRRATRDGNDAVETILGFPTRA